MELPLCPVANFRFGVLSDSIQVKTGRVDTQDPVP